MTADRILFVIDDLEYKYFEFNKLVTNFWLIKEFLKRGFETDITTKKNLFISNCKGCVSANKAFLKDDGEIAYRKGFDIREIETYGNVYFRPDPPVDVDYINACNVFEFVDFKKTKVFNNPLSIRNFNEKLHVNLFPQFIPKNIVTSSKNLIIDFVNQTGKAVIKPLNRCFGSGVFVLNKNDANLNSIITTATENEKTLVMVQEYLPGAVNGDKRVLIIGETVFDESVRKLPAPNDFKFAEHSDKYFEKAPLTNEERIAAKSIAKMLTSMGLPIAGLDMIDGKVIEINITSPCFFIKEINALYNTKFEDKILCELNKLSGNKEKTLINM